MMIQQAVFMGKPLTEALHMADLCYDHRREAAIMGSIDAFTNWRELSEKESAALIQPYNLRDPRLMETKDWVMELAVEKDQKGKYD